MYFYSRNLKREYFVISRKENVDNIILTFCSKMHFQVSPKVFVIFDFSVSRRDNCRSKLLQARGMKGLIKNQRSNVKL
jgi:hypothetical protein